MASEPTLSSLARLAAASALTHDVSSAASDESGKRKEQVRRHYIQTLHRVVDEAHVVLLVLYACDPAGCRSRLVEEEGRRARGGGQAVRVCVNKIGARERSISRPSEYLFVCRVDLVPRENAQAWLKHLRHTAPTLPFRSAGSHQRTKFSSGTAPALLRLLKAYKPCAAQGMTVGVVGFPNVGRSSLITTLKRAKASLAWLLRNAIWKVCAVAA